MDLQKVINKMKGYSIITSNILFTILYFFVNTNLIPITPNIIEQKNPLPIALPDPSKVEKLEIPLGIGASV